MGENTHVGGVGVGKIWGVGHSACTPAQEETVPAACHGRSHKD